MNILNKIDSKNIRDILALTPLQEGMLFHYLQDPYSGLYFEQLSLEIFGEIHDRHFEKAWDVVIDTNEMLRTMFRWEKVEKPSQIILKEHKCKVIFYDLSDKDSNQKKAVLEEIKNKDRRETFDLHQVPFRVILCKMEEKKHVIIISNHHILFDGWSNGIILKEFFKAYHELRNGGRSITIPVKPPYKEFIKWTQNQDRNRQEQFWREYLAGVEIPTELPIKKRLEETNRVEVEDYPIILEEDIRGKLEVFIKNIRVTLAPVFYTAWGILLQKYCGSEDVIFGTTVSGRSAGIKGIGDMVGLFINTLPLRVQSAPGGKIIEVLSGIENLLREREEFENTPLVDIRSYSAVTGSTSLFDTIVAIENYPLDSRLLPEDRLLSVHSFSIVEMTHYDLTVGIMPFSEIEIKFSFKKELFDKETIENLAVHFKGIIRNIIENPEAALSQLEIVSIEEKNRILYEFNNTAAEYPANQTIHQLFEEQAKRTPDNIAAAGEMQSAECSAKSIEQNNERHAPGATRCALTYRELNDQANRLAHLLIEKGVRADNIVGIMVERSVEMIVGILGILKAGGAYLPIDPNYPQERIDYMLKDSSAQVLVVDDTSYTSWLSFASKALLNLSAGHHLHFPCSHVPIFPSSLFPSLAYTIYTSGSTGWPKGVAVEHSQVANFVFHMYNRYDRDVGVHDRCLGVTNIMFDVSVWECFQPLTFGARLVLLPEQDRFDVFALAGAIGLEQITLIYLPPALLEDVCEQLKKQHRWISLNKMLVGVEPIRDEVLEGYMQLNPGMKIINGYGPTETTICATSYNYLSPEPAGQIVPIGAPLSNTRIILLDAAGHITPQGIPGEICISGDSVSRGYINNPELTNDKFKIKNEKLKIINGIYKGPGGDFSKEPPYGHDRYRQKIYRTGDLARWLKNGNIEFLGRIDSQVKIRGYRIELGEIENRLSNISGVKNAVVLVREEESGDKYLCAYVVSSKELAIPQLRENLSRALPDYMIPSYFVKMEKIPLTSNGKIDRRALPIPGLKVGESYTTTRNDIEKKLAALWSEILGKDALHASQLKASIGIDDNFFQLGGHSLKATILAAKIHKVFDVKVPLREIFKMPRIKELAKYIEGKSKELHISIDPAEEKEYYELSPAQKRLYLLQQLVMNNTSYNMPFVMPLGESIGKEKLESVFKRLIERHESLRTSFITVNEEPFQRIHREVDFSIVCYEVTEQPGADLLIPGFSKPFNLDTAPLLRVNLIAAGSSRRVLFIDMHHIITDGTSQGILEKEFQALLEGEMLQPLHLQCNDYSEWYNRTIRQGAIKRQESYWMKEFSDEIPVLNLSTDYPRPIVQSVEGNEVNFGFNVEETAIIKRIAAENNSTLYMCLLGVFNILLSKLSGQEDIIIGTPIAARRHTDLQNVIGMLVNTLAMRNYPSGDKLFREFLKEVNRRTLDVYENQEYPFEVLVDKITVNRDTSRNPVFDVMFNLLNQEDYIGDTSKQNEQGAYQHIKATSKFDMNLTAVEMGERLFFTLEYSTRLFKPERIDRIIGYFRNIVKVLSQDTGLKISELEIMDKEELESVLRLSRGVEGDYERVKTVCQWFEDQAARTPDNIAIVGNSQWAMGNSRLSTELSYKELNKRSGQLAGLLMEKGVKPDTIVGIMVERSLEMIIGILGILKAGGAYLPVDSEYPGERKRYMLEDGEVRWLLINHDIEGIDDEIFHRLELIDLRQEESYKRRNSNLEYSGTSSGLVYVIYTSGSTGRPKGVMLEHRNLVNLIHYQYKYIGIDLSRVLQFTTISFDVSAQEIFSALLSGGQLYLVNKETRTYIPGLLRLIERNGIKTVFLPVSFLKAIFKEEEYVNLIPRCIAHIITAGEQVVITNNFMNYLKERKVNLHNHYGPSETHVVTTLTLEPHGEIPQMPTIGKPVMNTAIYIMDKWGKPSPPGVAGEIHIGGEQVGRGYLNRPQLTAEKFLPVINRFDRSNKSYKSYRAHISTRIYKTGDQARYLAEGNIEFLGRMDYQVKIRGYRVEPGEIESRLLNYPGIKEVVVSVREEDSRDKYICAYVVSDRKYKISELREFLSKELPDYMIPSYFVRIEKIPLTPNRKIDRGALPKPELKDGESYTAPRNEIEKKLVRLWSEILGRDALHASQLHTSPGIDDNFFQWGGDSLKAAILVSRIEKAFDVKIPLAEIFKKPRIRELAGYIKETVRWKYEQIELVEKKEYYVLSSAQKRLYFLQQLDKEGTAYNISAAWILEGIIDKPGFEQSIRGLILVHESLRSSIDLIEEEPVQRVHEHVEFEIENHKVEVKVEDVQSPLLEGTRGLIPLPLEPAARNPRPEADLISSFIRPFDLSRPPLLRVGLVKLLHTPTALRGHPSQEGKKEKYLFLVDMHHIISDGISTHVLVQDFSALYAGKELPGIKLQYKDYTEWQNRERVSKKTLEQGKYWKKEYEGEIPVLELPADKTRPYVQSFEGETVNFEINSETSGALKALALDRGATLYIVLLTLYTVLLAKLSSQEDIVIGTPIAGRRHADLEKIIGMFVNTLALRNYPSGEKKFADFLEEVKEKTLEAFENQDYLYEDLLENVSVTRDLSRNPLFDTMFVLQNTGSQEIDIPGLKSVPNENENKTSRFDLTLTVVEVEEKLLFTFEYCSKLFKRETIDRFITYFMNIVIGVIEDKYRDLSGLNVISEEEKNRVLYEFNATESDYPKEKTIYELFEEQVKRTPDNTALHGCMLAWMQREKGSITYKELNEKSNRLAYMLRQKSVEPDTIVGIMVERSVEMIVGIMGILTSDGAYLPIDPDYPKDRIQYMLKDSNAKILLTTKKIEKTSDFDKEVIYLDSPWPPALLNLSEGRHPDFPASLPSNLAYIIYTSGSTGKPKGVMVENESVVNILLTLQRQYPLNESDVYAFKTPYMFDVSVTELFGWFLAGGKLVVLVKGDEKDPKKILDTIERADLTHINFVPSMFNMLVEVLQPRDTRRISGLKYIFLAGETLLAEYVNKFRRLGTVIRLENLYGPTEGTVYSSYYSLEQWDGKGSIPIGKPVANTILLVLDKTNRLQPIGVPGELCIGGVGLARGYLNQPELTSERFIKIEVKVKVEEGMEAYGQDMQLYSHTAMQYHPPSHHPITPLFQLSIYQTGDLARWLVDGNIEFLGRIDNQVKIRGFRIERGEIENRLSRHKNIKEAVVIDRTDNTGEKYLCAYIVFREATGTDQTELKSYLSQTLPEYMIPAHFLKVEKIPLSPNGKVNRNALPKPGARPESKYVAPGTDKEREIAEIWKQVLGLEKVSINDNFFDVGGNSLKIIKLVIELKKHLGIELPPAKMFQYTTIAVQARYIGQADEKKSAEGDIEFETDKVKNKLKQRRDKMRS